MAETAYSKFRLADVVLADLDALAASNGGNRSQAVREAVTYWRSLVEAAGRLNADELSVEDWNLLGHVGDPSDLELIEENRFVGDWSVRIAQELWGMYDGREIVLPIQKDAKKAAEKLAKRIRSWGPVRGYALMAALRYFWQHNDAGIVSCSAPEVWMTPTARGDG